MKSPKRSSVLELPRATPADRRVWAGLHTSAEAILAGLDDASEVIAMTSGAWSVVKLLALARARIGRPCQIDIWSWTFSRRAIAQLSSWRRQDAGVRVVVDASLWRRQPGYAAELLEGLGDDMRAASSHAKVARVSGRGESIFIAGSGNANLCRRAEFVFLSRDPKLSTWLTGLTDLLFDTLPAGAPTRSDDEVDRMQARAFPPAQPRPSWAAGLPTLGAR